jgi:hypothetical protein
MHDEQARPIVDSKPKFVVGAILLIGLTALLIAGGFVEGLISGSIAAVLGVLAINLLLMAYRSRPPRL